MKAVTVNEVNDKIIRAFGYDPNRITSMSIHVNEGGYPRITVSEKLDPGSATRLEELLG